MKAINAVVLAGGPPDAVSALQDVPNKAFVEIEGITLVERVLRALSESSHIASICVVAPPAMRDSPALALASQRRPDGPRITDSLRNGLAGLPGDDSVAIVTSDLPVLTPAAVDDFVDRVFSIDPTPAMAASNGARTRRATQPFRTRGRGCAMGPIAAPAWPR